MAQRWLLTRDYIDAHRVDLQTFESFARSLIDITLIKARETLGDQRGAAAEEVSFPLKVTVRPVVRQAFVAPDGGEGTAGEVVGGSGCTEVQFETDDGKLVTVNAHIKVETAGK